MFCFKGSGFAYLLGWGRTTIRRMSGGRFFLLWFWGRLCGKFPAGCSQSCKGIPLLFPMPFKKHAKITIENQHPADIGGFFYQIDYNLKPVPENAGYFCAQWRREPLTGKKKIIPSLIR